MQSPQVRLPHQREAPTLIRRPLPAYGYMSSQFEPFEIQTVIRIAADPDGSRRRFLSENYRSSPFGDAGDDVKGP